MDYYKEYKKLQNFVEKKIKSIIPRNGFIYTPARYVLSAGGKRIRPIITLLACESVGSKITSALNAAAAIEILHTFTLVHDDIMDNSDERRGFPTIHKKWNTATAILSGDILAGLAYKSILQIKSKRQFEVLKVFTNAFIDVCEGQDMDIEYGKKEIISINEYFKMISKKTAALISASAEIGGIIGEGTKKEILALKNFGFNLGVAFQIQDDLIDVEGDVNILGKPLGQDILEGKKTYLLLKSLELAKGKDLVILKKVARCKNIDRSFVNLVRQIYNKLGIIEIAHKEISIIIEKAKRELEQIPKSKSREILFWLSDMSLERKF